MNCPRWHRNESMVATKWHSAALCQLLQGQQSYINDSYGAAMALVRKLQAYLGNPHSLWQLSQSHPLFVSIHNARNNKQEHRAELALLSDPKLFMGWGSRWSV